MMIEQPSGAIDPYVLYNRLSMVKLDNTLSPDNLTVCDDFEYFSMIGRGSCSPSMISSPSASPQVGPRRATSVKQKPVKSTGQFKESNLVLDDSRPRTNSMPGSQRVRNFTTHGKSLHNEGDTVRSSQTSVESSLSGESTPHQPLLARCSNGADLESVMSSTYRILVMGAQSVGKTALTRQLLTSDDIDQSDDQLEEDVQEQAVSVLLNGQESHLLFMDSDYDRESYDPSSADAYIVVYSITDRPSFCNALSTLKNLRHFEKTKAIILCGNKSDLARRRVISTEDGKQAASDHYCTFIETSTMLNHCVDHLLVGMLRQIEIGANSPGHLAKRLRCKASSANFSRSIRGLVGRFIHRSQSAKLNHTKPAPPN